MEGSRPGINHNPRCHRGGRLRWRRQDGRGDRLTVHSHLVGCRGGRGSAQCRSRGADTVMNAIAVGARLRSRERAGWRSPAPAQTVYRSISPTSRADRHHTHTRDASPSYRLASWADGRRGNSRELARPGGASINAAPRCGVRQRVSLRRAEIPAQRRVPHVQRTLSSVSGRV